MNKGKFTSLITECATIRWERHQCILIALLSTHAIDPWNTKSTNGVNVFFMVFVTTFRHFRSHFNTSYHPKPGEKHLWNVLQPLKGVFFGYCYEWDLQNWGSMVTCRELSKQLLTAAKHKTDQKIWRRSQSTCWGLNKKDKWWYKREAGRPQLRGGNCNK